MALAETTWLYKFGAEERVQTGPSQAQGELLYSKLEDQEKTLTRIITSYSSQSEQVK